MQAYLASRFFRRNALQTIPNRVLTITVSFFLEDQNHDDHDQNPRSGHLYQTDQNIDVYDASFENRKKSLLMNPSGLRNHLVDTANQIWLGLSPRSHQLSRTEQKQTWICRRALARVTRSLTEFRASIFSEGSGCNITYFNFLTRPYMLGDLVYRIKLFCQMLNGSYTTNTHKLCSIDRFVI